MRPASRPSARATPRCSTHLAELGRQTRANTALADRIRHKYRLKNTTGLSLNALVDYDEPLDILNHLMVGSEGTLGFISAVTYDTVPDYPHKASALIVFPDVESCCRAVPVLKQQPVSAVELLDRRSLRSVENMQGMPEWVRALSEWRLRPADRVARRDASLLHEQIGADHGLHRRLPGGEAGRLQRGPGRLQPAVEDPQGHLPGGRRGAPDRHHGDHRGRHLPGRAAWPRASTACSSCWTSTATDEAIIFGHALEGNLHFVFTQGFDERGREGPLRSLHAATSRSWWRWSSAAR